MSATLQMGVIPLSVSTHDGWVYRALHRLYEGVPNATKLLARRAGKDPHSAKDWLRAKSTPSLDSMIALCAAHDELHAELNAMIMERKALCGR